MEVEGATPATETPKPAEEATPTPENEEPKTEPTPVDGLIYFTLLCVN